MHSLKIINIIHLGNEKNRKRVNMYKKSTNMLKINKSQRINTKLATFSRTKEANVESGVLIKQQKSSNEALHPQKRAMFAYLFVFLYFP